MISIKPFIRTSLLARLAVFFGASVVALPGSSLFVGFNTLTPVQVYDQNGNYTQDFGPAGAIAAFPDGTGHFFSVTPSASLTSSSVTEYSGALSSGGGLTPIGGFTLSNLITDGGSYANSLLLSAYNGTVYQTTATGSILSSWSTGYTHIGVTSNGTNVYTTEGDSGNLIDVWSPTGAKLNTIATPFVGLYGLAYDSATGDFWASTTNFVYQLSSTGSLMAQFDLVGDGRTPNGAVHDSLEVGALPSLPVATPEPSSLFLLLAGLLTIVATLRRINYGGSV